MPFKASALLCWLCTNGKGLAITKRSAPSCAGWAIMFFAVDIYGKGIRPNNPKDAAAEAAKYKEEPAVAESSGHAGFNILKSHELTDPRDRVIGYCFGGTTALEFGAKRGGRSGIS